MPNNDDDRILQRGEEGYDKRGRFTGMTEERDVGGKVETRDIRYYPRDQETYESRTIPGDNFRRVRAGTRTVRRSRR